jgi:rsbT co-antagonist protein RsbR
VLETGSVEALQHYARDLSERIIPRGVETHEVVGIVLLLRDVLARSLFEKYQRDFALLNRVLDAYEPAANRIANTVASASSTSASGSSASSRTPSASCPRRCCRCASGCSSCRSSACWTAERARQLTEQLLTGIRTHRAKVVVIDITGVPDVDESVANHLVQTVDASRLMGASVIITGLSPKIAQTLVTIGVDLSKMNTIGDLQGGIEEAERLLGYTAVRQEGRFGHEHRTGAGLHPATGLVPDRLDPHRPRRLADGPLPGRPHRQIGEHRSRGVIIDVAALDVLDSFGSRTLRNIAEMARLRGATTVIVGIQPDVGLRHGRLAGHGRAPAGR